MAIGYKSQGAGVSTETSGAALSPLCPATVDAGDILIAHVFWEGTTTAPSTPSGWDLLSGPHVIESTIARHWVFGKIAAGTEDGAAVAFGSPAVTTQRAARIYSFSGRVAGTITELVTGFSHQSHATDPQMPSVTTTLTGARAVALVAQNDNNTTGDATGESGGDWVEAVAEYVAVLTPGLLLQIQTCIPTANPGTVSGGSVATTNDPCGVIGFQIKESNNQTVSVGLGQATFAGFAPTVIATDNKIVTAGLGEVVFTGFAPAVQVNTSIVVGLSEAVFTGFAPTIQVSDNKTVAVGIGTATFEGLAPTIQVSDHKTVSVGLSEATFTGFAPVIDSGVNIGLSQAVFTGFAPTIQVSDHKVVNVGLGQVVFEGFAPTIQQGAGQVVNVGLGQAVFTGFAPSLNSGINIGLGQCVFTGFAPTIQITDHKTVIVGLGQALFTGIAPVVHITGGQMAAQVNVGLGEVVFTGFAPRIIRTVCCRNRKSPRYRRQRRWQ